MSGRVPIELRRQIIERDNGACRYCGKKSVFFKERPEPTVYEKSGRRWRTWGKPNNWFHDKYIAFHIDHVVPRCNGGGTDIDNLVLACRRCNLKKWKKVNGKDTFNTPEPMDR